MPIWSGANSAVTTSGSKPPCGIAERDGICRPPEYQLFGQRSDWLADAVNSYFPPLVRGRPPTEGRGAPLDEGLPAPEIGWSRGEWPGAVVGRS